mgnify:CR=1 FL=1
MKLSEIAEKFRLEFRGDVDVDIQGIAGLQDAGPNQISFLFSGRYRSLVESTQAAAIVLRKEDASLTTKPVLISGNPRLAWAQIAAMFDPTPVATPYVDVSAVVSDQAQLGKSVVIGPQAVIEPGAVIGDGAEIGAGGFVGEGVAIGAGTRLMPHVVVYHGCSIGEGCLVHSNVVIGADGFGFEFDSDSGDYIKIPQVYGVQIGKHVEIGAGTTVDRGALNDTTIGDGCKLDNQVQIGHGTRIDHHTVISGCTAIAGSTKIGSYCLIGGAVGIVDNIEITDQVEITAMTLVSQSILEKGRYSSGTGLMRGTDWKRSVVGFRKLDDMLKRLRRLESDR